MQEESQRVEEDWGLDFPYIARGLGSSRNIEEPKESRDSSYWNEKGRREWEIEY